MVRAKIDLRPRVEGYALYEVIGNNGKNLLCYSFIYVFFCCILQMRGKKNVLFAFFLIETNLF